jgi:hypothetical protein
MEQSKQRGGNIDACSDRSPHRQLEHPSNRPDLGSADFAI